MSLTRSTHHTQAIDKLLQQALLPLPAPPPPLSPSGAAAGTSSRAEFPITCRAATADRLRLKLPASLLLPPAAAAPVQSSSAASSSAQAQGGAPDDAQQGTEHSDTGAASASARAGAGAAAGSEQAGVVLILEGVRVEVEADLELVQALWLDSQSFPSSSSSSDAAAAASGAKEAQGVDAQVHAGLGLGLTQSIAALASTGLEQLILDEQAGTQDEDEDERELREQREAEALKRDLLRAEEEQRLRAATAGTAVPPDTPASQASAAAAAAAAVAGPGPVAVTEKRGMLATFIERLLNGLRIELHDLHLAVRPRVGANAPVESAAGLALAGIQIDLFGVQVGQQVALTGSRTQRSISIAGMDVSLLSVPHTSRLTTSEEDAGSLAGSTSTLAAGVQARSPAATPSAEHHLAASTHSSRSSSSSASFYEYGSTISDAGDVPGGRAASDGRQAYMDMSSGVLDLSVYHDAAAAAAASVAASQAHLAAASAPSPRAPAVPRSAEDVSATTSSAAASQSIEHERQHKLLQVHSKRIDPLSVKVACRIQLVHSSDAASAKRSHLALDLDCLEAKWDLTTLALLTQAAEMALPILRPNDDAQRKRDVDLTPAAQSDGGQSFSVSMREASFALANAAAEEGAHADVLELQILDVTAKPTSFAVGSLALLACLSTSGASKTEEIVKIEREGTSRRHAVQGSRAAPVAAWDVHVSAMEAIIDGRHLVRFAPLVAPVTSLVSTLSPPSDGVPAQQKASAPQHNSDAALALRCHGANITLRIPCAKPYCQPDRSGEFRLAIGGIALGSAQGLVESSIAKRARFGDEQAPTSRSQKTERDTSFEVASITILHNGEQLLRVAPATSAAPSLSFKSSSERRLLALGNVACTLRKAPFDALQMLADDLTALMHKLLLAPPASNATKGTNTDLQATAACINAQILLDNDRATESLQLRANMLSASITSTCPLAVSLSEAFVSAGPYTQPHRQLARAISNNSTPCINLSLRLLPNEKHATVCVELRRVATLVTLDDPLFARVAEFLKPPPAVFENVPPSERTLVSLSISESSTILCTTTTSSGALLRLDSAHFSIELTDKVGLQNLTMTGAAASLHLVEDVENESVDLDPSEDLPGSARVAELDIKHASVMQREARPSGLSTEIASAGVAISLDACADTLTALSSFSADVQNALSTPAMPEDGRQLRSEEESYYDDDDASVRLLSSSGELVDDDVPMRKDYQGSGEIPMTISEDGSVAPVASPDVLCATSTMTARLLNGASIHPKRNYFSKRRSIEQQRASPG